MLSAKSGAKQASPHSKYWLVSSALGIGFEVAFQPRKAVLDTQADSQACTLHTAGISVYTHRHIEQGFRKN